MKDRVAPVNVQQHQENSENVQTSEEFPVFDFSIPTVAMLEETAEIDDFTGDRQTPQPIVNEVSAARQQDLIKKNINELSQKIAQLSSATHLLRQEQEAFAKDQKRHRQWLLAATVLVLMAIGLLVWG